MGLLGAGLGLTFGALITSKAERQAGVTTSVLPAFSTASSFLPLAVTAKAGGRVLKGVRKLGKRKKAPGLGYGMGQKKRLKKRLFLF